MMLRFRKSGKAGQGLGDRRWRVFVSRKSAVVSLFILAWMFSASLFSEWITNSKPVVGITKDGRVLFPAYRDYNRQDLGLEGAGVVDYEEARGDFRFAIWPLLKWDPYQNDLSLDRAMSPPSETHLMGTDVAGRDVFARLVYGTRISFVFALAVWIVTYVIGTGLGLAQGYFGGRIDFFGQRLTEVFSSTPTFYLLLLLISLLSPGILVLIALSSLFGWVAIAQQMRAQALQNRNMVFCDSARALGNTEFGVLLKHVLPNSLIPLVTFSPFAIVGGIDALAQLDLLGFGVAAPTPSWGELLDQARQNFQVAWWLAFFPSLFLFVSIVTLNLVGEGLRAAFDPRSQA